MPEPVGAHRAWVRPPPTSEERALEIEELEREDREMRHRAYLRFGVEYLVWLVVGLGMMYWSFLTWDPRLADPLFWGGMIVGDGGMLLVLVRLQRHFEEHGLR